MRGSVSSAPHLNECGQGAAGSARSALRRWPDAIAIKKTVLIVTSLSEASARGSKGAFARASNTQGRLHVRRNFRAGGRSKKKRAPNSQRRCCRNTWTVRKTSMNGRDRRSISAYLRKPSDPYQKGSSENGHVRQRCRTGIHPLRFAPTEKSCKTGMYASRVESRRLRATTAAAFQKSLPELRPPWQGPSSQVEGGRPWVQGPRYRLVDITSLRTGRVLGYPTTRVIITRNHVLFGHHGAMRGTVARSCLTFCRIRGMGRGKNVPYLPPNREGSIRHAAGSRACAQYLWSWA